MTAVYAGHGLLPGWLSTPAKLARSVMSLEVLIEAVLINESVYVLPEMFHSLVHRCPELAKCVKPFRPRYKNDEEESQALATATEITNQLKSNSDFIRLSSLTLGPSTDNLKLDVETTRLSILTAMALRVPLSASQVEAPLCIVDQLYRAKQFPQIPQPASATSIQLVRQAWQGAATKANEFRRYHFYTINMPLFLLAVLRECADNRYDAILPVTLQMRSYDPVRAFRAWCSCLDAETDPRRFLQCMDDVEGLASRLSNLSKQNEQSTLTIGTAFTLTGPAPQVAANLPMSRILESLPWRNRHHRLMKNLFNYAADTGSLEREISRVFGVNLDIAREAVALIDNLHLGRGFN